MQKIITAILVALILINIAYTFAGILFHPLQSMDAIGIWFFKAKAIHLEHGFPNQFLHNPKYNYSHQQYPLGLPFLIALFWNFGEKNILLMYPLVYSIILLLTYKVIRRTTTTTIAIVCTYTYSMLSPLIAGGGRILAGNADIFLVLIGWLLLFLFYKKELTTKRCVAIVLLIMLTSQIKLEGIFFSIIILFLPIKSKPGKYLLFLASCIPFTAWLLTIKFLHIPSDTHVIFPTLGLFWQRIISIGKGVILELININNWYLFWPLILILTFIKSKLSPQMLKTLLPTYGVIMALYLSIYLFASNDTYTYVTSSFDRLLLQQSPIIFLFFVEKLNMLLSIVQFGDKNPSK